MRTLPRPRPVVQLLGTIASAAIALWWVLLVDLPVSVSPVEFIARALVFIGLTVGAFHVLAVRYWPLRAEQVAQLTATSLYHYTTAAAAAQIMNATSIPPGGLTGTAQLATGQEGRLTIITTLTAGRGAVYAWTGPLNNPRRHVGNADTVIEFSGANLPDPHAVRWHPNGAVRIPGGYTGPAKARPIP